MQPAELLERIAATLRRDIAPQVVDEYAKTQAFMAAVVVQKIAKELSVADGHQAALARDIEELLARLRRRPEGWPQGLATALAQIEADRSAGAVAAFVQALYDHRAELGEKEFVQRLAEVRVMLRRDIDRRMEVAR